MSSSPGPRTPGPAPAGARPAETSTVEDAADAALHASRALLAVVARSLGPALEHVTLPQFRALVLLATRGPSRSGVVAEHLGIHPSTFTRNADRLVAGGWVRRSPDPGSRQGVLVELTPAGQALVDDVTARRRADLVAILGRLDAPGRDDVLRGLHALAVGAGEPDPADLAALGV